MLKSKTPVAEGLKVITDKYNAYKDDVTGTILVSTLESVFSPEVGELGHFYYTMGHLSDTYDYPSGDVEQALKELVMSDLIVNMVLSGEVSEWDKLAQRARSSHESLFPEGYVNETIERSAQYLKYVLSGPRA